MNTKVVITQPSRFEAKKNAIAAGGADSLHILADFDRTLTAACVDGKGVPSLISVLRDGNHLTEDYAPRAHALFDTYHPIEIDPNVPFNEKRSAMEEWWRTHLALLIECGLSRQDIDNAVATRKVLLRDGFGEFASFLEKHHVPLVIMSAGGLGTESIALFLKHAGQFSDNVHIIGNEFEWDEQGRMIGVREPIIHALNKHETAIQNYPAFGAVRNRKNVILLGDNIDDIGMVEGFDYDHLITIGFLNNNVEENLPHFQEVYDVVLTGDPSIDFVHGLLKEIIR